MCKKKCTNLEVCQDIPVCAPVSSSQWTQSDACRLRTVGGVGFEVTGNITFHGSGLNNVNDKKINNYTSRTNRRYKSMDTAWISK